MSLIKQAEELEFVPKQQLIQMAQNPRGDYPPFLVISEIERRKQNERAFEAQQAKANMPTTTVAEESIMEFAGRGIAPSEPMLMAGGGITQMQVGGQTEQEILRNQFLQSQGITGNNSLAASFNPFGQQSEEVSEEQKGFLRQRYTKPDGSIDFGRAARDGFNVSTLALILFPEPITSAIGTGARGIAGLGSRLFESIRKRPMLGTRAAGFGALGIANVPDFSSDKSTDNKGITAQEQIAQESQNKLQQLLTNTATPTDTTDTDDRDRFLTIAQLGGVIGAARNPSELSAGLGQLAGNIQQQRRGEDMRQAELQLKQAQIAQVQSAIENLPIEQLNETYNAIIEGINAGQLDAEEYGPTLNSIVQRLMALQNIDLQDSTSILQETRVS